MTREEFLDTVAKYGLAHSEYDDFIEVDINSRYGKKICLLNFNKKQVVSRFAWCCSNAGEVELYFPQRVLSVDGYLVEIEQGSALADDQHKRFTKQSKMERYLNEVMTQLKAWRQEIKLTEVEWDF